MTDLHHVEACRRNRRFANGLGGVLFSIPWRLGIFTFSMGLDTRHLPIAADDANCPTRK
jgi:hypothetical protein